MESILVSGRKPVARRVLEVGEIVAFICLPGLLRSRGILRSLDLSASSSTDSLRRLFIDGDCRYSDGVLLDPDPDVGE